MTTPRCEVVELLTARDYQTLRAKELTRKQIRALIPVLRRMLDGEHSPIILTPDEDDTAEPVVYTSPAG